MAAPIRFMFKVPDFKAAFAGEARTYRRKREQAAHIATDRASREAQAVLRARMKSAGLGRLGNAVGQTSSLRKKGKSPYGVLYAKGGDDTLAGGALEAYTQGVIIRARNRQWLAFQTQAVQRLIGRRRMTPERYNQSSLVTRLGPLHFRPVKPGLAFLVARNVTLSPKDGRAKAAGKRAPRTRIPAKEVVVFVLIRFTRRGKRLDKDQTVAPVFAKVGPYYGEALAELLTA
jgi:hypothetical protein